MNLHRFVRKKCSGDEFEYFVAHHPEWITGGDGVDLIDKTPTTFSETNPYTDQDPESMDDQMIGLAEFANMNFASKNSIFGEDFDQPIQMRRKRR